MPWGIIGSTILHSVIMLGILLLLFPVAFNFESLFATITFAAPCLCKRCQINCLSEAVLVYAFIAHLAVLLI
ncbi:MAG: hypothetical protein ACTXOO_03800 [Sodalis sp. (in: enterobacteria)]